MYVNQLTLSSLEVSMKQFIFLFMLIASTPWAHAQVESSVEYKEVVRTYTKFSSLDFSECRKSFRFLNGNWMDCQMSLPSPGLRSSIRQIYPTNYPTQNFHLKTAIDGLEYYVDIRTVASSLDEASLGTRLWITGYYKKPGIPEIQHAPESAYSFDDFAKYLAEALERVESQRAFSSRMVVALDPDQPNSYTEDQVVGSVYVGKQTQTLDLSACRSTYSHELQDRWPKEDEWASGCVVLTGATRRDLPLRQFWSNHLRSMATDSYFDMDFPEAGQEHSILVRISYQAGSYSVSLGTKDRNGRIKFNVNFPYEEVERYLSAAFQKVPQVESHFMLLESDLSTLQSSERVLGKLVLSRSAGPQDFIDLKESVHGK
jgi:hypothetical protein